MDLWLAYQIALGVGLAIALAWAFDAHRYGRKAYRLVSHREMPTEEIELPPTMRIGPRLEDLGPGKPLPWPDYRR
jgi:hypothetical protein